MRPGRVGFSSPSSCAVVKAEGRPSSSMTEQLLLGSHMVPTSAIPRVSQVVAPQRSWWRMTSDSEWNLQERSQTELRPGSFVPSFCQELHTHTKKKATRSANTKHMGTVGLLIASYTVLQMHWGWRVRKPAAAGRLGGVWLEKQEEKLEEMRTTCGIRSSSSEKHITAGLVSMRSRTTDSTSVSGGGWPPGLFPAT